MPLCKQANLGPSEVLDLEGDAKVISTGKIAKESNELTIDNAKTHATKALQPTTNTILNPYADITEIAKDTKLDSCSKLSIMRKELMQLMAEAYYLHLNNVSKDDPEMFKIQARLVALFDEYSKLKKKLAKMPVQERWADRPDIEDDWWKIQFESFNHQFDVRERYLENRAVCPCPCVKPTKVGATYYDRPSLDKRGPGDTKYSQAYRILVAYKLLFDDLTGGTHKMMADGLKNTGLDAAMGKSPEEVTLYDVLEAFAVLEHWSFSFIRKNMMDENLMPNFDNAVEETNVHASYMI